MGTKLVVSSFFLPLDGRSILITIPSSFLVPSGQIGPKEGEGGGEVNEMGDFEQSLAGGGGMSS